MLLLTPWVMVVKKLRHWLCYDFVRWICWFRQRSEGTAAEWPEAFFVDRLEAWSMQLSMGGLTATPIHWTFFCVLFTARQIGLQKGGGLWVPATHIHGFPLGFLCWARVATAPFIRLHRALFLGPGVPYSHFRSLDSSDLLLFVNLLEL